MGKKNKIRYQSTPKKRVPIVLTGNVFLQYRDEDEIAAAQKGDMLVFPESKELNTTYQGEYERRGFAGYFKVDVSDGKQWCALSLNELFDEKQNHFHKTECAIDRYELCAELLQTFKDRTVVRTYRDHYELEDEASPEEG